MTAAELLRAASRARYAERKSARQCWYCGQPLEDGNTTKVCRACKALRSLKRKAQREQDRRTGCCTVCHRPMTDREQFDGIRCPECRLQFKRWQYAREDRQNEVQGR